MRKIPVKKWMEKTKEGQEVPANTSKALGLLLASRPAEKMPKGIDNFRLFNRVGKAFDDAEKTGFINLEEGDYSFIKKLIEDDIPASWGANPHVFEALEAFINAKSEGE